ncbi:MAG: anion permease [Dysgonomonas sp.]
MTLLITIIVLAIVFDFINGFHDAANSVATVVSTKVLSPTQAVIWAAFFNFVAFFIAKYIIGGFGVAKTISETIDLKFFPEDPSMVSLVLVAALSAAIIWNLITWKFGIPSSSSHTLIGGLAGAAIAACGFKAVHSATIGIIALFIVLAPVIGMVGGNIITLITLHSFRKIKPKTAETLFKKLQLVSSALLSIGHGLNDSQKVMGVIAVAIVANQSIGLPHFMQGEDANYIMNNHEWIALVCFSAIALGTMVGGWKIMKTMGNRITKITPVEGFCAQTAGALTLFITEMLHIPVSTTHVITGSIMGVGSVKRLSAVRWGVTKDLLVAWILTIPVSALMAGIMFWILHFIF